MPARTCILSTLTSASVKVGKVPPLNHELGNDAMKNGTLVVQWFAFRAHSLFACAECTKVFGSLWNGIPKEPHDNATAFIRSFDFDIKKDLAGDEFGIAVMTGAELVFVGGT